MDQNVQNVRHLVDIVMLARFAPSYLFP